jgi:hypothetical protein
MGAKRWITRRGWSVLIVASLGIAAAAGRVSAQSPQPAMSQVWLINTRSAPLFCSSGADTAQLDYWRLGPDNQWVHADQQSFLAADDANVPTSFCIHGNRSDLADSIQEGWRLYHVLQSRALNHPVRFVIWSWPAERMASHARQDLQIKASYSDGQSCYVAQLISRIDPRVPVSLVGYSFGARIATGALHMLAGGQVAGQTVLRPNAPVQRAPMRAVLVAAAEDSHWLMPGQCRGLALSQLDHLLITVNGADPVLKHYPMLYGAHGPEALGYVGPACGTELAKIEVLNVTCSVGKSHKWDCYLADPSVQARLPWHAFLQPTVSRVQPPGFVPISPPGPLPATPAPSLPPDTGNPAAT